MDQPVRYVVGDPDGHLAHATAQVRIEDAGHFHGRVLPSRCPTNQDLLNNGVTAIVLVNIEWGPISLSGQTASATTWETWSTTYTDGSTEQSSARNVYTLVQSGDTWKIQADTHPDAGQGPATAARPGRATPIPTPVTQPSSPSESASRNWAGYAATGGPFTGVAATWSVPSFSPGTAVAI